MRLLTLIQVSVFVLPITTLHAADPLMCPPRLDVQQQLVHPVPGWSTTRDDLPNQFAGITFFDGKPEEKASLAPDSESKRAGRIFSTWTFVPGRPIFVACHYALTTVMLMRPLPKEVHACTVVYNPGQSIAGLPVIEKIECK